MHLEGTIAMTRSTRLGTFAGGLAAGLVLALAATLVPAAQAETTAAAFHDDMRKLWEDHIVWTRQYIVSAATLPGDLADIGPTTDRLLANQAHIGDALKPFYGEAAGEQVTALLRDHILTAARLIAAAKAGDADAVAKEKAAWYDNGDDIAVALNGLNPRYWDLDHFKEMMTAHLDRTLDEAVARLTGDYAADIVAYEAIHADILEMANMLSDGIVRQFPNAFNR
jgi:hypothetical protein